MKNGISDPGKVNGMMMKKWICALVLLAICAAWACAEPAEPIALRFDEGFSLSLPADWVSYPPLQDNVDIRYVLGDGAGERFMYVLAQETDLADIDALRAAIDAREDCTKSSALDLNGQPFAAFIAPGLNASGCATIRDGELLLFLFTPQSDSDYMLTVAEIMASYENGKTG